MISESQERMLAVVDPARLDEVLEVCERWQTGAAIGTVTDTSRVTVLRGGEVVGDVPVGILVDGCPLYDLEPAEPEGWMYGNEAALEADDPGLVLLSLLAAQHRQQAVGVRAVRLDRPVANGARPSPRTRRC